MSRISTWLRELKNNKDEMRYAKRELQKGYLSQLRDIVRLRLGPSKLGIQEYYFYRLFDDKLLEGRRKEEFAGERKILEIDKQMNCSDWRAIANDKLLFYHLMEGLGLPYPRVKAVYLNGFRYSPGALALCGEKAVQEFLRSENNYPLFLKPIQATYGRGAMAALNYYAHEDSILMGTGNPESVNGVVDRINANLGNGYIFSELLKPHADVEAVCGPRLSSVRVIMLFERGLPQLFRATWKVPTGKNMIDNFSLGRSGNLIAFVNVDNGQIERVVGGIGASFSVRETHPDTNKELVGICLPCWNRLKQVCMDAASALPGLRMQHWDIALASSGPVVLELNVEGGWDLHQLATLRGMYDRDLRNALSLSLQR